MVVHALCSTPIKLNGKTQFPQEPPDPLPDPLPVVVVVGEDVDDPEDDELPREPPDPLPVVVVFIEDVDDPEDDVEDDPEDPGGEQVLAPVSWESIQFLKWLT